MCKLIIIIIIIIIILILIIIITITTTTTTIIITTTTTTTTIIIITIIIIIMEMDPWTCRKLHRIRESVKTLYNNYGDDTDEISRDPRTKGLKTRRE